MPNSVSIHGELRFEDGGLHFISTSGVTVDFGPILGNSEFSEIAVVLLNLGMAEMAISLGVESGQSKPQQQAASSASAIASDINAAHAEFQQILAHSMAQGLDTTTQP